jgi:hypothetical protein
MKYRGWYTCSHSWWSLSIEPFHSARHCRKHEAGQRGLTLLEQAIYCYCYTLGSWLVVGFVESHTALRYTQPVSLLAVFLPHQTRLNGRFPLAVTQNRSQTFRPNALLRKINTTLLRDNAITELPKSGNSHSLPALLLLLTTPIEAERSIDKRETWPVVKAHRPCCRPPNKSWWFEYQ